MKAYPEEGWDEQPFTAKLLLPNGETITLAGVTVRTIDARVQGAMIRMFKRKGFDLRFRIRLSWPFIRVSGNWVWSPTYKYD